MLFCENVLVFKYTLRAQRDFPKLVCIFGKEEFFTVTIIKICYLTLLVTVTCALAACVFVCEMQAKTEREEETVYHVKAGDSVVKLIIYATHSGGVVR